MTSGLPNRVEAVVFDFDGVLTDNTVWVDQNGVESVRCNRSDGLAFRALQSMVKVIVISTEANPVVEKRCQKMKVPCKSGVENKLPVLEAWLKEQGVPFENCVYVGNDVNDLDCLKAVGCGMVVRDSNPDILPHCDVHLQTSGGHGVAVEVLRLVKSRF